MDLIQLPFFPSMWTQIIWNSVEPSICLWFWRTWLWMKWTVMKFRLMIGAWANFYEGDALSMYFWFWNMDVLDMKHETILTGGTFSAPSLWSNPKAPKERHERFVMDFWIQNYGTWRFDESQNFNLLLLLQLKASMRGERCHGRWYQGRILEEILRKGREFCQDFQVFSARFHSSTMSWIFAERVPKIGLFHSKGWNF